MILNSFFNRFSESSLIKIGFRCFLIGLFLLPSTAFLSILFLLASLIIASFKRKDSYWHDYWNYPLLIVSLMMIFGCFRAHTGFLAWIGLANWLPFFWCFWGFKPYLLSQENRKDSSLALLTGTLPVIITGLGQLWFGWQGPWQLLDGLIVWYVAPGGEPLGRLSGLFDYANIAGTWLAVVWPFSLAALFQSSIGIRNRFVCFLFLISIIVALILTDSRNAWGGLIVAIPLVLGPSSWFWLLPLMLCFTLPVIFAVVPIFPEDFQQWGRNLVPDSLWMRLNDMKFSETRPLEATRIHQWKVAITLILDRPLFGWGAAAFSILYPLYTGFSYGHSHNLPLDLAVNHGIFVSFLINLFVFGLLITSLRMGIMNNTSRLNYSDQNLFFDRAWWASCFILVCIHASDMPFFDSRINMIGWILLAGLRAFTFPSKDSNSLLRLSDRKL